MAYRNYLKAMKLARECDNYCTGSGVSNDVISAAEKKVGILFSRQLKEYLTTYGYMEFFGVELYGIVKTDFSSVSVEGCLVEWTILERKNGLNPKWLPICFEDDGNMAFLDFNDLDENGEPSVILAEETERGYEKVEKIANDFGNYVLELVEWQLNEQ